MEAARPSIAIPGAPAAPELDFRIEDAGVLAHAAVPTIRFGLAVEATRGEAIRSVMLETQIRIAATRRAYDGPTQDRLNELFGEPRRWATTLRSLLWTHTTMVIPPFEASTVVDMNVAVTYDFEVVAAKYMSTLREGEVPLEFLFGGTVFYSVEKGGPLQIARIGWDREAEYRLPVAVWRETMDRYFPASAWLRLDRATFDRLYAYKASHALTSWEQALDRLLPGEGEAP